MKFTRERKYTVNMGNYESLVIGGSIEVEADNMAPATLDEMLDTLLADEIKEAQELTHFDKSYILSYRVPQ